MFKIKWFWNILTLNMLNCFKDYKRCIPIQYRILDFVQQKKSKVAMEQPYMLLILYRQYHACWWSGDFRSQGISRHGIGPQSQNIPSPASEELKASPYHLCLYIFLELLPWCRQTEIATWWIKFHWEYCKLTHLKACHQKLLISLPPPKLFIWFDKWSIGLFKVAFL